MPWAVMHRRVSRTRKWPEPGSWHRLRMLARKGIGGACGCGYKRLQLKHRFVRLATMCRMSGGLLLICTYVSRTWYRVHFRGKYGYSLWDRVGSFCRRDGSLGTRYIFTRVKALVHVWVTGIVIWVQDSLRVAWGSSLRCLVVSGGWASTRQGGLGH